ncbi:MULTISPECIES: DegV family protein [Clostridium]|uniref:DegV family protein n=1 Tax=Clostridium senegalense TaxID=1465809 RepID=A0A6M0GZM2_9CLOT|nr:MULTISPECIES: DegV family protein [Clostridium]NEU03789.1 DegV family protein [Clostridium senegalense]
MKEKIKIITDSTCDIPKEIVEKYDVEVIPQIINVDGQSYLDGVEITLPTLLEKMEESNEFPKTGQINPHRFVEIYEGYLKEGYKIVAIHMSSKMSGTYQSALVAKDLLETEDVFIIDSQAVCAALGVLVLKAAILRDKGLTAKEIYDETLNTVDKVKSITCFQSLTNLIKGGRLSKTAGAIGSFLGIKLLLTIKDGEMTVMEKIRGNKKVQRSILEYLEKYDLDEEYPVIVIESDFKEENASIYDSSKEFLNNKNAKVYECPPGCSVGVHSGNNVFAIFFIEK